MARAVPSAQASVSPHLSPLFSSSPPPSSQVWDVRFPEQQSWRERERSIAEHVSAATYAPEPGLFFNLFPFHILVDQDMRIVQVIGSMCKWCLIA